MSVPRYRPNKYFIPGLSQIWKPQGLSSVHNKSTRNNIKNKEIFRAYDQEVFVPSKVKIKKQPETSRKKKEMVLSFQGINNKGLGSYRYLDSKVNSSSKKQIEKYRLRDRSSFLESYRPTSRTSRNASTSRIDFSYSKDSSRRLLNKSKIRDEVEIASRLSDMHPNEKLRKGKSLFNEGRAKEAEAVFNELISEETNILDCHYFLGIIEIRRGGYQEGIDHFNHIVFANQQFKKSVYLFLSMAYKGAHMTQQSLDIANKGLKLFPKYFDLLMYRGKLLMTALMFQEAEKTFTEAIGMKSDYGQAYFKRAQCLVELGFQKKAISILTTLLYIDKDERARVLEERAKLLFRTEQIQEAKKDIERIIDLKSPTSDTFYLKGQIEEMENRITEAILCYQQSITLNTSKSSIERSLIAITKCKINDLDYYSAHHQISRSAFLNLRTSTIQMYRLLTEGVVFLMKRKIQEGLNNFQALLDEYLSSPRHKRGREEEEADKLHVDYVLKRFYVYRAYGYYVLGRHQLSIKDYVEAQKYVGLQRHSRYNLTLAEGVVEAQNLNFQKAYDHFQKARSIYPTKLQPLLYRAVTLVQQSSLSQCDQVARLQSILSALKELDSAYDINPNHSNLLFLRTLVFFYLGKINEGLESISRAMSKSEENIPKYFFYRGLGHGTLRNYKQCQNDFTIVINLNNNYSEAYLERAKTFFINQNVEKGLDDIRSYVKLCPWVDQCLLEGNLYFSYQNFEEALQCYDKGKTQGNQASQSEDILIMKTKCYICLGDIQSAIQCLEQVSPSQCICDLVILKYLRAQGKDSKETLLNYIRTLNQNPNTHLIFNPIHIYCYIGCIYFQLGEYKSAQEEFRRSFKERQFYNIEYLINKEEYQDDETVQEAQLQMNQIHYNIFICHLMLKEVKKAHDIFIRHILPMKDVIQQGEILSELCEMIFHSIKGVDESEEIRNDLDITMFTNPLSDGATSVSMRLKGGRLVDLLVIQKTKVSYLLPSIVLKEMRPEVNQKVILEKIRLEEVENKPEPPWVRRNDESTLIFTGEIQDVGIEFQTEENQETTEYQQEQKQEESSNRSSNAESYPPTDMKNEIEKLKNAFKLDDSIQRKLNTFIKKTK